MGIRRAGRAFVSCAGYDLMAARATSEASLKVIKGGLGLKRYIAGTYIMRTLTHTLLICAIMCGAFQPSYVLHSSPTIRLVNNNNRVGMKTRAPAELARRRPTFMSPLYAI